MNILKKFDYIDWLYEPLVIREKKIDWKKAKRKLLQSYWHLIEARELLEDVNYIWKILGVEGAERLSHLQCYNLAVYYAKYGRIPSNIDRISNDKKLEY